MNDHDRVLRVAFLYGMALGGAVVTCVVIVMAMANDGKTSAQIDALSADVAVLKERVHSLDEVDYQHDRRLDHQLQRIDDLADAGCCCEEP